LNGREFVDFLYRKYYPELEGPILAVRKALAELDPKSPAFAQLMHRQAKKEISHARAFSKAVLQFSELEPHERAEIAHQAAEEYEHYALLKDFLKSRDLDIEDLSADAYGAYFDQFLTGDVEAFRLCNIAEKSAVIFLRHLRDVSRDPDVRRLAEAMVADEEGHEEMVKSKLAKIAEDESKRDFLEKQFVQSWASQKTGVFLEAKELGLDLEKILASFRQAENL
jgi:rubrerythrin